MAEFNKIQNDIVILNVGGIKFTTASMTLQAEPESMLGVMFSGRYPLGKQEDGSIFIDRDGTHFRIILNYLRGNISSIRQLPKDDLILSELLSEVEYYQLGGFLKILEPIEKKQTVINQSDLSKNFRVGENLRDVTTEDLSFRSCRLNNLTFENIEFKHSLDLNDCSLLNTKFLNCFFFYGQQYSFDRTDLNNFTFECCHDENGYDIIDMIKNKLITFYGAKNFELAVFDEQVKSVIKETYNL